MQQGRGLSLRTYIAQINYFGPWLQMSLMASEVGRRFARGQFRATDRRTGTSRPATPDNSWVFIGLAWDLRTKVGARAERFHGAR